MNCYASFFFTWLTEQKGYLEELINKRLWPEFGLERGGFQLSHRQHHEIAAILKAEGLRCAFHLPFYQVRPGSADKQIRAQSLDLLRRSLDLAQIYQPDHLIGHPEFMPFSDSQGAVLGHRGGQSSKKWQVPASHWLEYSAKIWTEVANGSPARLYLENTSDSSSGPLAALLDLLPSQAGICLDLGHWFLAADDTNSLSFWLESLAGRLAHLHLHDNHGQWDEHLGMGWGSIDYQDFFEQLGSLNLTPTFTLEAHRLADLEQSLAYLNQCPIDGRRA